MKRLLPWIVPCVMLLAWQAASQFGVLANQVMPAPIAVVDALVPQVIPALGRALPMIPG